MRLPGHSLMTPLLIAVMALLAVISCRFHPCTSRAINRIIACSMPLLDEAFTH
jgi:hypothetical protein